MQSTANKPTRQASIIQESTTDYMQQAVVDLFRAKTNLAREVGTLSRWHRAPIRTLMGKVQELIAMMTAMAREEN